MKQNFFWLATVCTERVRAKQKAWIAVCRDIPICLGSVQRRELVRYYPQPSSWTWYTNISATWGADTIWYANMLIFFQQAVRIQFEAFQLLEGWLGSSWHHWPKSLINLSRLRHCKYWKLRVLGQYAEKGNFDNQCRSDMFIMKAAFQRKMLFSFKLKSFKRH